MRASIAGALPAMSPTARGLSIRRGLLSPGSARSRSAPEAPTTAGGSPADPRAADEEHARLVGCDGQPRRGTGPRASQEPGWPRPGGARARREGTPGGAPRQKAHERRSSPPGRGAGRGKHGRRGRVGVSRAGTSSAPRRRTAGEEPGPAGTPRAGPGPRGRGSGGAPCGAALRGTEGPGEQGRGAWAVAEQGRGARAVAEQGRDGVAPPRRDRRPELPGRGTDPPTWSQRRGARAERATDRRALRRTGPTGAPSTGRNGPSTQPPRRLPPTPSGPRPDHASIRPPPQRPLDAPPDPVDRVRRCPGDA